MELEVVLDSSKTYVVIPCTFKPLQEGKFSLTFQCSGVLKITPLPPNKEWKWVTGKVVFFNLFFLYFFLIFLYFF